MSPTKAMTPGASSKSAKLPNLLVFDGDGSGCAVGVSTVATLGCFGMGRGAVVGPGVLASSIGLMGAE
jgi:hypothetical protein